MSSLLQLLEEADEKSAEAMMENDDLDYFVENNVNVTFCVSSKL